MLYYSLEIPAAPGSAGPDTGEVTETLESLVAAWAGEVERARAAERGIAGGAGSTAARETELEALRRSHRALVETLERSISQLEALHEKAAGLARAVADPPSGPADPAPPASEPQSLCLTASGPTEFPVSVETDIIDETNRLALATLDISRWRPLKRRRALRRATGS